MQGSKYSYPEKLEAAIAYLMTGSSLGASAKCGINSRTIRDWTHQGWWEDVLADAKAVLNDKLDGNYTRIIHKGIDTVLDRLENGEKKVNRYGDTVTVPVSAKDAMHITTAFIEKRDMLRAIPGQSTETESQEDRLSRIKKALEEQGSEKAIH